MLQTAEILVGECSLIRNIWCSLPFYLMWERRSRTSFFVLHRWTCYLSNKSGES